MKNERDNPSQLTPAQVRRELKSIENLVSEGRLNPDILERKRYEFQIFPSDESVKDTLTSPSQVAAESPMGIDENKVARGEDQESLAPDQNIKPTRRKKTQAERVSELISAGSKESPIDSFSIIEQVWGKDKDKKKGLKRLSVVLSGLRKEAAKKGEAIVNISEGGMKTVGQYYTEKIVKESEDAKNNSHESSSKVETTIPDQKEVPVQEIENLPHFTNLERKIYNILLSGSSDSPIQAEKIIELIWGGKIDKKIALSRLSVALPSIKKKLISRNMQIINSSPKGKDAQYFLKNLDNEPEKVEIPTSPISALEIEESEEEVGIEVLEETTHQRDLLEEAEFIAYVPTKDEVRSNEETRILDAIVSSLLSDPRIKFEDLQRNLYNSEKSKQVLGGQLVYLYDSRQIKDNFVTALAKLREEALIPSLRDAWEENDIVLLNKVEIIINKMAGNDIDLFIKKVKEEISRSERQFYRDYPAGSGQKVTMIRRPHNG